MSILDGEFDTPDAGGNDPDPVVPKPEPLAEGLEVPGKEVSPSNNAFVLTESGLLVTPLPDADEGVLTAKPKLIRPPLNVTPEDFKRVVIAAYSQYMLHGVVTVSGVAGRSRFSEHKVKKIMLRPEFVMALRARGVELSEFSGLTEHQDLLLQILADPFDGLTHGQKLKKAGVSTAQYSGWLKQPEFLDRVKELGETWKGHNEAGIIQLQRKVGEGDLNAIKFLMELNKTHDPHSAVSLDIIRVMQLLLESLSRHVKDPAVLSAVAEDMRHVIKSQGLAMPPKVIEGNVE